MDFKNIWQTVRSRSFISSSSDRPEVPARAAAAAAAAKGIVSIPEYERLFLASTSGQTSSVYSARPRGVHVEPLEEQYFEKDFDPVRYLLEQLPEEPTQEFFDSKVSQRMVQLDDITEKLSRQVMEHHEEMVKGMQMVTEIEKDLQVTKIICKNGRRRLSMAMNEVSRDLGVADNVKKKKMLMETLPFLERLQRAVHLKSRLDSTIEEGNFGKALHMCSECLHILDGSLELTAVQEMSSSIEEWLQRTIVKVDAVLLNVCYNFDVKNYTMVIDAYAMIDDVAAVADKVQTFYAQVIVSKTYDVLKEFLPQSEEELHGTMRKGRLPYNDLCLRLPDSNYRVCLHKTLEVLFDVLCAYHQMMACEWLPQSQSYSGSRLQRSRSHGSLNEPAPESYDRSSSTEFISASGSQALSMNVPNGQIDDEPSADGSPAEKLRTTGALEVAIGLQKGRKTIWELAARRVAALLSSDAICAYNPHQFLQSLDLLNKFILSGEAFSGAEAIPLRARLVKQSERYFGAFHRQNLEVLRMMLEKEPWHRLPSGVLQSVNLAGLTGNGAAVILSSPSPNSVLQRLPQQGPQGFNEWFKKGNPFTESRISSLKQDGGSQVKSLTNGNASKDDDDEDEDLLADFIDEDSQRPSRSFNKTSTDDDAGITVTSSSISILRSIDKYARLMQVLQPISLEVLKGLCQVFELYFFTVFKLSGQRDPPSAMTSRLRSTLVRISQELEEQRLKYATTNHHHAKNSPVYDLQGVGPALNVYAVKERVTAAESLMYLASTLRASGPRLHSLLQQNALPLLEQFFSRTVDVSFDLRDHLYRTLARQLLNIGGYIDRIANTRWELKELGTEHNGYVNLLVNEFRQYTQRLSNAGISKQICDLLFQYGTEVLVETLVEGYSRVRRCTNEGRALMSLDLQVLNNGIQHLNPTKQRPNFQLVDVFIKAFYLPETEHLFWVKAHPEYSKAQVISLINLVANMNNWKKKTRTDLLEKIESGDF